VPPRWSAGQWWEEARAQGALAACDALRAFEPNRLVPLDAFLYRRVVESVWTRYRQGWSFGRRCRLDIDACLPDRLVEASDCPDAESLDRLVLLLGSLREADQLLIPDAPTSQSRGFLNWRQTSSMKSPGNERAIQHRFLPRPFSSDVVSILCRADSGVFPIARRAGHA
jgi:hypothetical protein